MSLSTEHVTEEAPGVLARMVSPYLVLNSDRRFGLVFVGQTISLLGDWLYVVSLIVIAYNVTHSAVFVSVLTFVRLLPYALLMPFLGTLADRGNRRLLLLGANFARAACVLGLLAMNSNRTVWIAFPLVLALTTLASVFRPALRATVPAVVAGENLVAANSLLGQAESITFVVGPALGSAFVLAGRPEAAFLVTGAAYFVSGLCFLSLTLPPVAESSRPNEGNWAMQTFAGFRFLLAENGGVLAAFTATVAATAVVGGAFWTLLLVLAEQTFHLGAQGTGYLNSAYGVGGLVGGVLVTPLLMKIRLDRLFVWSAALTFLSVGLVGLSPAGAIAFACLIVFGIGDVATQVAAVTVIQTATPGDMLGRIFGAFEAALIFWMLIGTLAAGAMVSALGPRVATLALAAIGFLTLAASLPLLNRMEQVLGVRVFLRQVPVLSTLSLQVLDDLARRLQVEKFPTGAVIIRSGDEGDKLYIVKTGTAEVFHAGESDGHVDLGTLGPMDHFGEIALLRDVPRTATVRALHDVEAYSLARADFNELLRRSRELESAMAESSASRIANTQSKAILRL